MTPIDFQPSDIHLDPSLPLCSTLGRAERELAAAYLVLTLQHLGDGWDRAVTFDELRAAVLVHSVDPRCRWLVGAVAPDFIDLVQHGQAVKVDAERMRLEPVAVEAMRVHVRRAVQA